MAKSKMDTTMNGDEVVISGISGIFPKSNNILEFWENLYNKVDMVTVNDSFKNSKLPEIPVHCGKISGLEKFDAQFFKVSYWQVMYIDPLCRKLLEHTFQALFDAGINPVTLAGKRIGVYSGTSLNDHFVNVMDSLSVKNMFVPLGACSAMLSNRISYWLDSKCPSFTVDCSCVTSSLCLEKAVNDIKLGLVDAVIVGVNNACNHPILNYNLRKAGLLCLDGKTKSFDKTGDGYVRSEAVTSIFLQRAKDAKRIYAEICHVSGNYHLKNGAEFLPICEVADMETFLRTFYKDIDVPTDKVEYIEANGAGIEQADKNELEAIDRVFGSTKSLTVGSLKSNIGHSEAASGVCSVIKMCLAYRHGVIPANLHYSEPIDIDAIKDNRIKVAVENTPFDRGYTAINNYSLTGGKYHILMRGHYKSRDKSKYQSSIPHLIVASGREENSVNKILNLLSTNPVDAEQIALLHEIYLHNIPGHTGRGFIILETINKKTESLSRGFDYYSGEPRPLWFVYSGMGSQWPGMGTELMKIPIFARSIERLQEVLKPKGVDIIEIITTKDKKVFNNILNSFVGISAIQIALTDSLKELGVVPDYIIGHSLGEHACAYADGCLTAEEMILSSYYRGLVSVETEFIHGAMAAIGLGYEQVKHICPSEIEIACRNSSTSCTISGPALEVSKFVKELTNQGIFAKSVNTANIPFHSKYTQEAATKFRILMDDLIKHPKQRSNQWLCTSQPQEKWDKAAYCSGEYFTSNFLNPVYFEDTAKCIPDNAIVIEIAPHGLLQAILQRSHTYCTHISLTNRAHSNPATFLLEGIGRLYQAGLNPKISVLYPKVQFPVSTETPPLSHFIEWEHSEDWPTDSYDNIKCIVSASRDLDISVDGDDCFYYKDYIRNGVNIFPESGILVFVWETLAMYKGVDYLDFSVRFDQVYFEKEVIIKPELLTKLHIQIHKGSGRFEITLEKDLIANGFINEILPRDKFSFGKPGVNKIDHELCLNDTEIYEVFKTKGYLYGNEFKTITSFKPLSNEATIKWRGNWVTFIDGIIQLNTLVNDCESIARIKFIDKLRINVRLHATEIVIGKETCYNAVIDNKLRMSTKCGGIILESIVFDESAIKPSPLEKYPFTYYDDKDGIEICSIGHKKDQKIVIKGKPNVININFDEKDLNEINNGITVNYIGLCIDDIQKDVGKAIEDESFFGMTFSGINCRGQRVMGISKHKVCKKILPCDIDLLWPLPEYWNIEEAATVPIPYLVAYYCLTVRSNLKEGFSILVTDGASPLGQALITLCLSVNCELYITVDNNAQKLFILKLFPALYKHQIAFSHEVALLNLNAFKPIANRCQIVINCGSGELRRAYLKFVSPYGIFLDLNEEDMKENRYFEMYYLFENKHYKSVRVSNLFLPENIEEKLKLQLAISDGIAKGVVKPLSRIIYSYEDMVKDLLSLSNTKHKHSILLNMEESLSMLHSNIQSRFYGPEDVILVICNDSEIIIQIVDYMRKKGIQKCVIHSKQESVTNILRWKILKWKRKGTTIFIEEVNLDLEECIEHLLNVCSKLGNTQEVFIVQSDSLSKNSENIDISPQKNLDLASRMSLKILKKLFLILISPSDVYLNNVKVNEIIEERKRAKIPTVIIHSLESDKHNLLQKLIFAMEPTIVKNDYKDDISQSSLKEINKSDMNSKHDTNKPFKEMTNNSLKALFSVIKQEDFFKKDCIVKMKALTNNLNEIEINPESVHLIMIPGFEGHSRIFESIAVKLKIAAVTLQLLPYTEHDSIKEIAASKYKLLKLKLKTHSTFYILGYSFGVNIALELSALMEKDGHVGTVFCVDSSPDAVKVYLDAYLGKLTDNELQNAIIEHVYEEISGHHSEELKEALDACDNDLEKIETLLLRLRNLKFSNEYVTSFINTVYKRILLARDYTPNVILNSDLVLMRGTPHTNAKGLNDDYGLSKYTTKPLKIFDIKTDHISAPYDFKVAYIINKMLDPKLLREINKKNLCHTYLMK